MDAGRRPLTSGDDARRTLELLTALYKSAFTGEPVTRGSIKPGDPFYTALNGGLSPRRMKDGHGNGTGHHAATGYDNGTAASSVAQSA